MKKSNQYRYNIELDLSKDAWNWYDGCNSKNYGINWKSRVPEDLYKNIFNKTSQEAYKFLIPFLEQKYVIDKRIVDEHIKKLDTIYNEKFSKACEKMVELTGKELYRNDFTFFITTFPRCPYNSDKGYIWEYIGWDNSIGGFMHELLHFQFHHYWRENPKSAISTLNEKDFNYLKESLTVILDNDLLPLIESPDRGYAIHQDFRNELHKFWENNKDFSSLVDYGLIRLKESVK